MDLTHLHLLLNHFPIVGTLIGGLLMLWGMAKNQKSIKNAAAVMVMAMTIIALPVYLTGEPAEERVEHLPGISETMVEEHEEAAELAIWVMAAAGVASLAALALRHKSTSKPAFTVATLITLLAFAAMARAGYFGGQIRHTELRTDQQAGQQTGSPDLKLQD
jgi:predicted alpha/beta-hydrolase family hydrolase